MLRGLGTTNPSPLKTRPKVQVDVCFLRVPLATLKWLIETWKPVGTSSFAHLARQKMFPARVVEILNQSIFGLMQFYGSNTSFKVHLWDQFHHVVIFLDTKHKSRFRTLGTKKCSGISLHPAWQRALFCEKKIAQVVCQHYKFRM